MPRCENRRRDKSTDRLAQENLLLDPMYEAPGSYIRQVVIDSKVVTKQKPPIYLASEQKHLADQIIAEDDDTEDSKPLEVRHQMTHI